MKISISHGKGELDASHHKRFASVDAVGENFLYHVTTSVWSPISWEGGIRLNANFMDCAMLALDFDSGEWTLDDTIEFLTETKIRGCIGTTKSHQKEKTTKSGVVSPACDRFRLFLVVDRPFTNPLRYTAQMRILESQMPIDKSCKDLGRFFYPCKEIIYMGGSVPYQTLTDEAFDELMIERKARLEARSKRIVGLKNKGMLPRSILKVLRFGGEEGFRHVTAYRAAAELSKFGWDEEDTIAKLAQTNLIDIGIDDLERAVQNGRQAATELEL